MNTQPLSGHCLCNSRRFPSLTNPPRNCFADLDTGTVVMYHGQRVVKITNQYFNIRPYENGAGSRMVNAMIEKTGELIKISGGIVF